jgi:hypothetical protein
VVSRGIEFAGKRNFGRTVDPRILPHTMLPPHVLMGLVRQVDLVVRENIPGALVECGVWKGGGSFLMADRLRRLGADRPVWMFDSFAGMPDPDPIDGPLAAAWASNPAGEHYYDNCVVSVDDVRATAASLDLSERVRIVPGWFDDTLEEARAAVGPIALLRIDCDWYAGVRLCLETFYDQVSEGGLVVIDDYGLFDGCNLAVHEFLAQRQLPHTIAHDGSPYFRKVSR